MRYYNIIRIYVECSTFRAPIPLATPRLPPANGERPARGGSYPSGQPPGPAASGEDKAPSPDHKKFHTSTTPTTRGRKSSYPGPTSPVWKSQFHWPIADWLELVEPATPGEDSFRSPDQKSRRITVGKKKYHTFSYSCPDHIFPSRPSPHMPVFFCFCVHFFFLILRRMGENNSSKIKRKHATLPSTVVIHICQITVTPQQYSQSSASVHAFRRGHQLPRGTSDLASLNSKYFRHTSDLRIGWLRRS